MDELHSEENYVKVPHWVMSYLMTAKLNMTQFRIMHAVTRNTFGFHKTWNQFSLNFLSQMTNCSNPQVTRELGKLIDQQILIEKYEDGKRMLSINPALKDEGSDQTPQRGTTSLVSRGTIPSDSGGTNSLDSHIKKKNKEKDIKEKHYIDFDQIDDMFITFYLRQYKKVMKKEHVKISEDSYMFIETQINYLVDCGTEQKEWEQQVKQFFKDPIDTPNNRSIVYFLNITYRYFDVGRYDQFDK